MSSKTRETRQRVLALLERFGRLLQTRGHEQGLKPVQWEALRYLRRANRFSRTPGGLTAYLGSTKGTVSQTLIALESKGLVRKKAAPTDRRAVCLELTAAGRRALDSDPLHELDESFDVLGQERVDSLERSLTTLLMEQIARAGGRPFGLCSTCSHFERDSPGGRPHRCSLLDVKLSDDDSRRICIEHLS